MEYIKVSKNVGIDYTPKDRILCERCKFMAICPYEWFCDTVKRMNEYYENVDNDDTDLGDDEA